MTIRTVGELMDRLREFPPYRPLGVEVIVGGDVDTDVVELERLEERTEGNAGPYLLLAPGPSGYEVREHIDNGLAAYHAIDDAEQLGNGYLRYTRDEDGHLILDHVDATLVVVLDEAPKPAT